MAGMRLMGVKASLKKARMTKNWAQVDLSAEEGLALTPWDADLNADMGEATSNLGFTDVAVFGYRKAVESDPNNKVYLRSLGRLLEEKGEFMATRKLRGLTKPPVGAIEGGGGLIKGGMQCVDTEYR
jgi:hypothetical protein